MSAQVHHLESSIEVPLETVHEYADADRDYPGPITDLEIERRNSTLLLKCETDDDSIGTYTPTCQLRATVTEKRIYETEQSTTWSAPDEDRESELVSFACFKGTIEDVLQNTAVQYPMFEVLKQLAEDATCGTLRALSINDDSIETTMIDDGEPLDAKFEIVPCGDHCDSEEDGVNWSDNEFIKS